MIIPKLSDSVTLTHVPKNCLKNAKLVEGIPVQTGVHAAGVIIADKPVSEYAPMFWER